MPRSRRAVTTAVATTLLTALAAAGAVAAPDASLTESTENFRQKVSVDKIERHLRVFQAIADEHGDRAAGTPGYEASAAYVERVLQGAGYETTRQWFPFLYFELLQPEVLTVAGQAVENHVMSNSPSTGEGGVTAPMVQPATTTGCDDAAWTGVDATGQIALVSRGACTFLAKSQAAGRAGAEAVIIYNNQPGALNGTLGDDPTGAIPSTGITQEEGQRLVTLPAGTEATLELVTMLEERETFNVLTETEGGSDENVVMLGGHLDGVHGGPGLNDNGSGVSTMLTVAEELAKLDKPGPGEANKHGLANTVRFAFWGAEESGLVGSTHYVEDLAANDPAALDRIATYLNFDMIGSPNYIVAVYDADQSTYEADAPVPPGSIETEAVFTDYYDSIGQPWVDYAFSGRSDYQAFINNGVAAGGLSSGSDGLKTEEQAVMFGGVVGEQYDQNYHSPQDDIDNVNREVLDIHSDAMAHATLALARDVSLVQPAS
jgi:Zn-dependent M28 family amino/carboxypeptidase